MTHRMAWICLVAVLATGCVVEEFDELGSESQAADYGGTGYGGTGYGGYGTAECPCQNPPYDCPTGLHCDSGCIGTGYGETLMKWAFAATNYSVSWTLDNVFSIPARHAGPGIVDEYGAMSYDQYGNWTNRGQWYSGYFYSYPYRSVIYSTANHGRTINSTGLTSGTSSHGMINASYLGLASFRYSRGKTLDDGTNADNHRLAAIDQCLSTAMTDGFCDRMCGNDAYTLPPSMLGDRQIPSWRKFTQRQVYAPFDPYLWSQVSINSGVIPYYAPTYGHNSNTDAVAEKTMFDKCRGFISQIQASCDPPQNVASTIRTYVVDTCNSVCKMYRTSSSQWPASDSNLATFDSGLGKYVGNIDDDYYDMGQPGAGNYDTGGWGYAVGGM